MRIYDIALMFIRASVAMSLVRESFSLANIVFRDALLPAAIGNFDGLGAARLPFLLTPIIEVIASLVILAAARPIARFAAKLAETADVSGHF
jgi:hypothetical protein